MKKTVLVIGDRPSKRELAASSISDFLSYKKYLKKRSVDLKFVSYRQLLRQRLPKIDSTLIIVMLFFPYNYWNKNIEIYSKDNRMYGDRVFGRMFFRLFNKVERKLRKAYKGQRLIYVNPPYSIKIDRDKKATKALLKKSGILTPPSFDIKDIKQLYRLLKKCSLYIKPRFGAMGKGMTYLTRKQCLTNYLFVSNKIRSLKGDCGWKFRDITDITERIAFLKKLLKKDMLWEEAIERPTVDNKEFDLRIYVVYGKVPYLYARSIPLDKVITNWSQGGRIEKCRFLKKIPPAKLELAKKYAVKAAKATRLNFTGIDVLFSSDYKYVHALEVHSFPSHEKGFNLMKYLIKQLAK